MSEQKHSPREILDVMERVEIAAVATSAGDKIRNRMMHYAADENFTIYLATMKGDPKTVQMTNHPSIALLVNQAGGSINESKEIEISGKAVFVRDDAERERALAITAKRSPVVKYLVETGNAGMLDCVKVVPTTIKFRIFSEIVQGMPPTVIEFPENQRVVSDWQLVKTKTRNWVMAIRVPFLTASLVPVLLGSAIAWLNAGSLQWGFFLLTLVAGISIHIATNVLNDYADHKSRNDDVNQEFVRPFSGGSRVIQLGLLTPVEMLTGAVFFFVLSAGIGVYLAWATKGYWLLLLGAIGLISGVFYTLGPLNWAKKGLGEAVVGVNFGALMTLGAYYVQTQSFAWLPVITSIPVSLLIFAVLYINEFPDYTADKQVGKKTLVVRLGRKPAVVLYAIIMAAAYAAIGVGVAVGVLPLLSLMALVTLPLAIRALFYARRHYASSFDLVPANALTVTIHLATGLLLTLAFVWQTLGNAGIVYVALIGVIFLAFIAWMYRYIERQKNIFFGLKQAIGSR
ncbi:MAG: 1,4-dihydroxy-2-naphthoate octaprenyltransferase [Chloroflexi bacterium]|nr:1,4-dihydroxy-2-naphthoate octaprenyltransferase [Chloroflexota bacterium]